MNRYNDYEVSKRARRQYGPMKLLFRPVCGSSRAKLCFRGGFSTPRAVAGLHEDGVRMTLLSKITEQQRKTKLMFNCKNHDT